MYAAAQSLRRRRWRELRKERAVELECAGYLACAAVLDADRRQPTGGGTGLEVLSAAIIPEFCSAKVSFGRVMRCAGESFGASRNF